MSSSPRLQDPWMFALALGLGGALAGCSASTRDVQAPIVSHEAGGLEGTSAMAPPAPPADAGDDQAAPVQSGAESSTARPERKPEAPRSEPAARPGLGTSWGETRTSRITTTPFHRADPATPFTTATMFYNDAQGARAMASGSPMLPQRRVDVGDGVLTFGMKDGDSGRFLTGFESGGHDYVVGEAGQRYVIVIQNNSSLRLEVVVSVDGLDVIDGKPASFGKRGYLVDGNATLEVDGFRQSEDAVAAFRFGSVSAAYASKSKTGDARNVGVIGLAVFHEQGTTPALWRDEVRRRQGAQPFPGQFATPPGQ